MDPEELTYKGKKEAFFCGVNPPFLRKMDLFSPLSLLHAKDGVSHSSFFFSLSFHSTFFILPFPKIGFFGGMGGNC